MGAGPPDSTLHWLASWGSAQMIPEPQNALAPALWRNTTLRQVVQVSLGGARLRVRISNTFGTAPLVVDGASIARSLGPGRADVEPSSLRRLYFSGRPSVTIPAGADYHSDPVELVHEAGANLALSLHFQAEPARQTGHGGSRTTSFVAAGERVMDADLPASDQVVRWYQFSGIEVLAAPATGVLVAIGDSITDGYGSTTDGNDRWTDVLGRRLRAEGGLSMALVNAGIGGGRLLRDGLGPNLMARFERDVLMRSGVTHAIVQVGVNDLGSQHRDGADTPAARRQLLGEMQAGYRQLAERGRAHGVCVIGATVSPYLGSDYYRPADANEADREALNAWIRSAGVFDAVADFDAALRDPARPARLLAQFDSGDHLHPSLAGYRAMAQAVPLDVLRRRCRR